LPGDSIADLQLFRIVCLESGVSVYVELSGASLISLDSQSNVFGLHD